MEQGKNLEVFAVAIIGFLDMGNEAHEPDGLELFAGDGSLQAAHYVDRLASIELWEIDGDRRRSVLRPASPFSARSDTSDRQHPGNGGGERTSSL